MPLLSVLMRTTQHSTAASLLSWYWKCEIEYHTDTHLTSYRIAMLCLEVWQLERPVNVIYQSQQSVDVLLLCEIWHNADSVSIRRLHAEGLSVSNVLERGHVKPRHY